MLLEAVYWFSHDALLVVEETEFEKSISLSRFISLLVRDVQELFQMLDSLMHISIFWMRLRQLFVSFPLFWFIFGLLAQSQELI
jgi:hypothetical protein